MKEYADSFYATHHIYRIFIVKMNKRGSEDKRRRVRWNIREYAIDRMNVGNL